MRTKLLLELRRVYIWARKGNSVALVGSISDSDSPVGNYYVEEGGKLPTCTVHVFVDLAFYCVPLDAIRIVFEIGRVLFFKGGRESGETQGCVFKVVRI